MEPLAPAIPVTDCRVTRNVAFRVCAHEGYLSPNSRWRRGIETVLESVAFHSRVVFLV